MKKKIGIIGATGYTGIGVLNLLLEHPQVEVVWITSRSQASKKISSVYPHLIGKTELVCKEADIEKMPKNLDLVFLCLEHGQSASIVPTLKKKGVKIVDMSADFRFKEVYGVPELKRKEIKKAKIVANPGCYATASILAITPLAKAVVGPIIVDAKSGVSGTGRTPTVKNNYSECAEAFSPYKVAEHRHQPEIEMLTGAKVVFVPHLTPMVRGILVTAYLNLKDKKWHDQAKLTALYENYYKGEKFVRVLKTDLPSTKNVSGTNFCDIAVRVDANSNYVIVMSAIDNLMKGAAGQAVQNMNLVLGLPEGAGLSRIALYP
jgi:N-acetyl-gamma-glutamyl-phosphate reductase